MNPKLRYALIMLVGVSATIGGGWLCVTRLSGWGGTAWAVVWGLLLYVVCVPLLRDCARDMRR